MTDLENARMIATNSGDIRDAMEELIAEIERLRALPTLDWRPIAEIRVSGAGHRHHGHNMLLVAPELVNLDCNPLGISDGYWQDDGLSGDRDPGAWLAARYDMNNDEWVKIEVTPTHFAYIPADGCPLVQEDTETKELALKYLAGSRA